MNIFGYARVSTGDQNTAAQVEQLQASGCTAIYKENASGGRWDRPELHKLLDRLGKGDVLVVWKLGRLSRSLSDLLHILKKVDDAGAGFRSLAETIDTTTPVGRMLMQVLGSFAEFERAMVKERTMLGLARARAAGRVGGARFKLTPAQQKEAVAGSKRAEPRLTSRSCSAWTARLSPACYQSAGCWAANRSVTLPTLVIGSTVQASNDLNP
jgi:DNA invertase Pin-like site-specific DNA recombinase